MRKCVAPLSLFVSSGFFLWVNVKPRFACDPDGYVFGEKLQRCLGVSFFFSLVKVCACGKKKVVGKSTCVLSWLNDSSGGIALAGSLRRTIRQRWA